MAHYCRILLGERHRLRYDSSVLACFTQVAARSVQQNLLDQISIQAWQADRLLTAHEKHVGLLLLSLSPHQWFAAEGDQVGADFYGIFALFVFIEHVDCFFNLA